MKNKLLITTAISTIALSSLAVAETKISGSLDITYNALSSNKAVNSNDGWGRESQVNFANSGDLNNGMKYAAGFSLEFDGNGNGSDKSDENLYIDFISGNSTFSIGQDHGMNTDSTAVPRVSIPANSFIGGRNYNQGAALGNGHIHVKEAMGVALAQNFGTTSAQIRYVPEYTADGGSDNGITTGLEGSGMDIVIAGDLGVKGLNVNLQYAKTDKAAGGTHTGAQDGKGTAVSASYNFGQVSVGYGRIKRELGQTAGEEYTSDDFGITFAASDKLSFGVNYVKTDAARAATPQDEKIKMVQAAYNLGAVGIAVGFADVENLGNVNTAGSDTEQGFVRLSTKF